MIIYNKIYELLDGWLDVVVDKIYERSVANYELKNKIKNNKEIK